MKLVVLPFIILTICLTNLRAQGGVNVQSIPIDSVDYSYINKEVKIDFKGTKKLKIDSFSIKDLYTSYTEISIDNKLVDIIEYDGHGTDYWHYDYAYIELHNYKPNLIFRVSKCVISEIENDSIKFQWTLMQCDIEKDLSVIKTEKKNIWISKTSINSILIRK